MQRAAEPGFIACSNAHYVRYPIVGGYAVGFHVRPRVNIFGSSVLIVWVAASLFACGRSVSEDQPERIGYCAKGCSVASDCCPVGAVSCPGAYPQNYACEQGLCRAPQCVTDTDCDGVASLGVAAACLSISGRFGCVVTCTTDADCSPTTDGGALGTFGSCTGLADNGVKICRIATDGGSPLSGGCKSKDAGCPDGLHCRSNGACGCDTTAECQALGLAACTDDPRFQLPPAPGTPH